MQRKKKDPTPRAKPSAQMQYKWEILSVLLRLLTFFFSKV